METNIEKRLRMTEAKCDALFFALRTLLQHQSEDRRVAFVIAYRAEIDRQLVNVPDSGPERDAADEVQRQAAVISAHLTGRLGGPSRA